MTRIESVRAKWRSANTTLDYYPKIMSSKTEEAFENLILHVKKGCLSDIPPSGTTSTNENIHKNINAFFQSERMGPELAMAFISIFFYVWNRKKSPASSFDKLGLSASGTRKKIPAVPVNNEPGSTKGKWTKRFNNNANFSSPFYYE